MSTDTIKRVGFVSLGCPKNLVDSEQMLATLVDAGYELVADHDEADAIIINTCGFLEASKEESVEVINEAVARKESGRVQRVVAAGCLVQRQRAKLLDWCPGIDAMIGVFDRDHIVDAMQPTPDPEENNMPHWIAANGRIGLARPRPSGFAAHGVEIGATLGIPSGQRGMQPELLVLHDSVDSRENEVKAS